MELPKYDRECVHLFRTRASAVPWHHHHIALLVWIDHSAFWIKYTEYDGRRGDHNELRYNDTCIVDPLKAYVRTTLIKWDPTYDNRAGLILDSVIGRYIGRFS